jgi:beta-lactam-binding protein with PASTA domain
MAEENVKQVPKGVSVIIVVLISLIISFVVSFFSYFYIFPGIEKKTYVRVVDIRNIPVAEASKKLESIGLRYEIVEQVESDTIPAGCVILQQPLPKTLMKKGSEVLLILSKGVPTIKVPDVKLKSVDEAKKMLTEAGLTIGEIKEVDSEEVEKGKVVSTEPQNDVEVKKGTIVLINVSKGKPVVQQVKKEVKKVIVPDIVNKSLIEAKKLLEQAGLRLGSIKKVCDENKDFDIVVSQLPKAGSTVLQGSKVDIVYNAESE